MAYSVKTLSLTGVLDQAFSLLRNRFVLFFAITLLLYVPIEIVRNKMVEDGLEQLGDFNPNFSQEQMMEYFREMGRVVSPAHGLFNWLSLLLVFPFTNAALIYATSNEYLGRPKTLAQTIQFAFQKVGSVIWADLLEYLVLAGLVFATAFFCVLLGALIGPLVLIPALAATVLFFYLLVRFSLSTNAVVIEDLRGMKALERSGKVLHGNYSQYMVLGLVLGVIKILILLFGLVANLVPNQILRIAVECGIEGILYTLSVCIYVVFYFSCRCKLEDYDLTLLASSVSAETVPSTQVDPAQPQ